MWGSLSGTAKESGHVEYKAMLPNVWFSVLQRNYDPLQSRKWLLYNIAKGLEPDLEDVGAVAYPGILFGGGGSTNSVEDREKGDLGAVPPSQGFWTQL